MNKIKPGANLPGLFFIFMYKDCNLSFLNLGDRNINCIVVSITKKEYEDCEEASKHFWGNSKPGKYGNGLCNTNDDPFKTARVGYLGQMAFSKLIGTECDLKYRKYGDKQDDLIGKYKVDVKCATSRSGNCLILHTNEKGKICKIDKDFYVSSFINYEFRDRKIAEVGITGFVLKSDIANLKTAPGKGSHINYVVTLDDLRPIWKLVDLYKAIKDVYAN